MNTKHYKAAAEATDADERALIPAFERIPTVNVQHVSEADYDAAVSAAQDKAKLGRLRAYLRPILAQQAKNIAQAAAHGISDFEAMKRGNEMLARIENEDQ